jgi:Protein of unknown function (DUF2867)
MQKAMKSTVCPLREVAVPSMSSVCGTLGRIDFSDAYEVQLTQPDLRVEEAYWAVFGAEPAWVRWLMNLRGHIAVRWGLMHPFSASPTSPDKVPAFQSGVRVGPFTLQSISEQELIVGDDDHHLNFRISALKSERAGQMFLTISTVVEIHNKLGRLYMLVVKPFHRFIAPFMVRRAVSEGRL